MSNINYENDKNQLQGKPVTLRQEEFETAVLGNGTIVILALNGKLCFQARNLEKSDLVKILTEVIEKIV
jgi:hypothetical protein